MGSRISSVLRDFSAQGPGLPRGGLHGVSSGSWHSLARCICFTVGLQDVCKVRIMWRRSSDLGAFLKHLCLAPRSESLGRGRGSRQQRFSKAPQGPVLQAKDRENSRTWRLGQELCWLFLSAEPSSSSPLGMCAVTRVCCGHKQQSQSVALPLRRPS